jgi:4,5:9,10-diseco-3-hydroxy-5,9,17-trioxoandrosta-1(10),2-diene-4-oate hydrolase
MVLDAEARVVVDGVSLAIKRSGRGLPVVGLTAVGHDAHDFAPLAQRTADRCELICIEWPSHGDSGADHLPASAARYAQLIAGALPQLGVDRPIVIGNSIGGAAAILLAAQTPVRGLVLCDSGGLVEVNRTVRTFCALFERFFAAGARGAWWYPRAFAAYYRLVLPRPEAAAQRHRIVAHARILAPVLREAWASFGAAGADIRDLAASLDIPVWVAWATHDRVIPLRSCRPAIERIRHATLDTFDAGHTPFLEQPDAFARGFVAFVESLAREPAALRAAGA